jgi:tRNA A-37 threonylcarbamoyl transferase component Bud32
MDDASRRTNPMPTAAVPTPETDPGSAATRPIVVADHYEIHPDRPLGTGGMSIVYEARDLKNRRTVAIRTLRAEHAQNPETRARFRKEARTMAFIQHPNVARVYDLWEDDASAWVAMELVPGKSLRDVLAEQGTLSLYEVELILDQCASALEKLHSAGMVHLDVKPANLIQTPDGTIKLIDFGLAQQSDQTQELLHGMAYGSAAYLSPEQASGEAVDAGSDVYSLGCVVYELLTGRAPFEDPYRTRTSEEMLQAHLNRQPDRPSEANRSASIPDWCDELVLWALIKEPADRLNSPRRFAELFAQGVDGRLSAAEVRKLRTARMPRKQPVAIATAPAYSGPSVPFQVVAAAAAPAVDAAASYSLPLPAAPRKRPFLLRVLNPMRPALWRLIFALLVVNALLAAVLYVQRGEIPGIISANDTTLAAGDTTTVAVDGLNLRAEAGMASASMAALAEGQEVYLRGEPVELDGETWWPVTVGNPADGLDGYVWAEGLHNGGQTIRERIDLGIDHAVDRVKGAIGV